MRTLDDLFRRLAEAPRDDLVLERTPGSFRPVSSADFADRVHRCAAGLEGLGVGAGDRVGLVAANRPEWHVVDFAVHRRGAVLVPLFGNLTDGQFAHVLGDSGAEVLVAEGPEQRRKVAAAWGRLPALRNVVELAPPAGMAALGSTDAGAGDDGAAPPPLDPPGGCRVVAWDELLHADARRGRRAPGPAGPDALATLIYTSGTTGVPKGVMLSHRNIVSNVEALLEVIPPRPGEVSLSVLPLCHVFQRTVDYSYLAGGTCVAYGSPHRLPEDFLRVRPHCMVGVPRLYQRFQAAVLQEAAAGGRPRWWLFEWARRRGLRRARHELEGEDRGVLERLAWRVADVLVLSRVRRGAGGRIRYLVSGGAALDAELGWWFESMGLRLIQGYGLTESSPVIAVNPLDANRIGTVGPPLPGVEVKIAADGEILTRGPHVMAGYWNDPDATDETIVDGWLLTGDVGSLDDDGYLRVADRKKHLLVTSTGKNVAPQPLENALSRSPMIEQVCVVGDDRPFIAALIVPDRAMLASWAGEHELPEDLDELLRRPEVQGLFEGELERLQTDFARYERVRGFRLLDRPFTIEEGTLTPTLKPVRRRVLDLHAGLVEELYRDADRRPERARRQDGDG